MVNRADKTPLYYQLYQIMKQKIRSGEWKAEDTLPTELDLGDQYELSRSTVRQAFDMLVNDGLIFRRQGQGTFVAHATIEQRLTRIISFTEDMLERGFQPGTKLLSAEIIPAPEDIASAMDNLVVGEELANVMRLRLADDEPMSIEYSFLVHKYCPEILRWDYSNTSLKRKLAEEYGIHLTYAQQKIRAISASTGLAKLLSVDEGDALLYIERIFYSDRNLPIELLRIHLRGDRYTLYSEMRG
jgi:GntR family transcriptional regulator